MSPKRDTLGHCERHVSVGRLERWKLSVSRFVIKAPDDDLRERVDLLVMALMSWT